MTLRGKIIDFVRLDFLHNTDEICRISKIAIVQQKVDASFVWITIQMIDAVCIDQ